MKVEKERQKKREELAQLRVVEEVMKDRERVRRVQKTDQPQIYPPCGWGTRLHRLTTE